MRTMHPLPLAHWLDAARQPAMVGYAAQRIAAFASWQAAAEGKGQALFITGAAGTGKGRMLADLAAHAHEGGGLVLSGRCFAGRPRPLRPFVDMVEHLVADGEFDPGISSQADELAEWLRSAYWDGPQDLDEDFHHAGQRLLGLLDNVADRAPLVVTIDSIHWASPLDLQIIEELAREVGGSRILLAATLRTSAPDYSDSLGRTIARVSKLPSASHVDLDGLSVQDVATFVSLESGQPIDIHDALDSPAQLSDQVKLLYRLSGGNPRLMQETWPLVRDQSTLDLDLEPATLPLTLVEDIRARLAPLSPHNLQLLRVAALAADAVNPSIVASVAEVAIDEARDALGDALGIGLVSNGDRDRYAFRHDVVRRWLAGDLTPSERTRLHGRYAAVMEREYGDDPRMSGAIAVHYESSSAARESAYLFHQRAARHARTEFAFGEASRHHQAAADLAPTTHSREILLLEAADDLTRSDEFALAMSIYDRVSASSYEEQRCRAALGFAEGAWITGRDGSRAVALLTDALQTEAADNARAKVELRALLSRALDSVGSHSSSIDVATDLVGEARLLDDRRLLVQALVLPLVASPVVDVASWARIEEAIGLTRSLADITLLADLSLVRASAAYSLGVARAWAEAVTDLDGAAELTGRRHHEIGAHRWRSARHLVRAEFARAQVSIAGPPAQVNAGSEIEAVPDDVASYLIAREHGLTEAPAEGMKGTPYGRLLGLAAHTELGRIKESRTRLLDLVDGDLIAKAAWRQHGALAAFLTEAALLTQDASLAEELYAALLPRSGTNLIDVGSVALFGSADRFLGVLAGACGLPAEAHFEAAIAMDAQMGSLLHQTETLARFAEYLRPTNPSRAAELAKEASSRNAVIGSRRISRIAAGGISTPSGGGVLTKREIEVVRLLARGMSNREIADHLYISQHTAANHVRHILTKTYSSNRTEAAWHAAQAGLLDE